MSGTTSKTADKKRFGKFAASSVPMHGKAVNAGPLRGDTKIRVTGLTGLKLTVEPIIDEPVPASVPAEGGTTA